MVGENFHYAVCEVHLGVLHRSFEAATGFSRYRDRICKYPIKWIFNQLEWNRGFYSSLSYLVMIEIFLLLLYC